MKSRGAEPAQGTHVKARAHPVKRGWIVAVGLWGLAGSYPACSDAEFKVSAQGGTAGSAGNAGASGRDASGGDGDAEASAGRGGSSGSSSGGTGGTPSDAQPDTSDAQPDAPPDARPDAPTDAPTDSAPVCDVPLQYFLDADHDTYGADDSMVRACTAPGPDWVLRGGDCRDELPEVRPDQNDYKPEGYETKQGVSFDYNCSGHEEPDPVSPGMAGACPSLGCTPGTGYVPVARPGPGVNPICGSQLIRACVVNLGVCSQQAPVMAAAKRCR